MLFELGGKRKRLIQVIYALLAMLMAGSLIFLGIGTGAGGILGGLGQNSSSSGGQFTQQADDLDKKLLAQPNNPKYLISLFRARYNAANSIVQSTSGGSVNTDAVQQYQEAVDAWDRYIKTGPKPPDANGAGLAANAFFTLAQNSAGGNDARNQAISAAQAQKIVADTRPAVGPLSTYAIYAYFAGDFAAGDTAAAKVESISSGTKRKAAKKQLDDIRKQAKQFEKQLTAFNKSQAKGATGASGATQLQNPLSGGTLGGP